MIAVVNILFGNRPGDGFEMIYNSLVLPTKQKKIFFHSVWKKNTRVSTNGIQRKGQMLGVIFCSLFNVFK